MYPCVEKQTRRRCGNHQLRKKNVILESVKRQRTHRFGNVTRLKRDKRRM